MSVVGHQPKRLIEVDLPIKRISAHARREKSIRHGHISTMHIWWARRPLAACRAVLCASLWLDPADPLCPDTFRNIARTQMKTWAKDHLGLLGEESFGRFVTYQKDPSLLNNHETLRSSLLDFLADFANWDNSTVREYLDTTRALTQAAHEALGGLPGMKPLVVDPFAGGGSIPLEALRIGADAFASDLNPIPILLNKVLLEYIPKYGSRLVDEVRKWGAWIKDEAEIELEEFYPKDLNGNTPIAYLWARTIQCEGPDCGAKVPLVRSFLLGKRDGLAIGIELEISKTKNIIYKIKHAKTADSFQHGTLRRGSATCPVCGFTMQGVSVRKKTAENQGGANTAMLLAVYCQSPNGRVYRDPTDADYSGFNKSKQFVENIRKMSFEEGTVMVPDEELPYLRSIFNINLIGVSRWDQMFSARQLASLLTLTKLVRKCFSVIKGQDPQFATAVATVLAFAVDRQADYSSSICTWVQSGEFVGHTFAQGQSLPIKWDFAEVVPFASGSGNWEGAVGWIVRVLDAIISSDLKSGNVQQASATDQPLPNDSAHLIFTDPPYYDSVPYADLSDFFYVWLKRTIGPLYPSLFKNVTTPKTEEIVQLAERNPKYAYKTRDNFERLMGAALSECRRVAATTGLAVIVFAHKGTAAWETMLQAILDAGWVVTGSWPIDTEMGARLRARNSAALASSVHLVCRPRENMGSTLQHDEVGDWREVLQELPRRIHSWMPRLAEEGIVGADAIFACLGPALEVFSHFSRVEKASGEVVILREYLEQVWAAVSREALSMIFQGANTEGFEPDARLTAMWLWTLSAGTSTESDDDDTEEPESEEAEGTTKKKVTGFLLDFDAARKIAQGLGASLDQLPELVQLNGETARLLPVAERAAYLFGKDAIQSSTTKPRGRQKQQALPGFEDIVEEVKGFGLVAGGKAKIGITVLDRVHQAMLLFGAGRNEALKAFLVDEGMGQDARFWRLAQAFSALYPRDTQEKRWVDGVLARKKSLGF